MSAGRPSGPVGWLRASGIRVQFLFVLVAVPLVTAIDGIAIAPAVVEATFPDADERTAREVLEAVEVAIALTVLLVAAVTGFAMLVLRRSIRHVIDEIVAATRAIAAGDLRHRIASRRTDELGQLSTAIDAMAMRLERLERGRREALACVSHELKTPLTIIQGHAYTLARSEDDAHRRGQLQVVQDEVQRLARIVGDLLDASSLRAGGARLQLERCDLVDLVRREAGRCVERAAEQGIAIELGGRRPRVEAQVDPARLGQVVANLLDNAVRHAPTGSTVSVVVDTHRGADAPRTIVVENRCAPIPPELAQELFRPFVQGGGSGSGSVGLGLAIVEAIVEAHGGTIQIDAALATHGIARFRIVLPPPVDEAARRFAAVTPRTECCPQVPGPVRFAGADA